MQPRVRTALEAHSVGNEPKPRGRQARHACQGAPGDCVAASLEAAYLCAGFRRRHPAPTDELHALPAAAELKRPSTAGFALHPPLPRPNRAILGLARGITFDMRGMTQTAKPAVACPLDGRVRRRVHGMSVLPHSSIHLSPLNRAPRMCSSSQGTS